MLFETVAVLWLQLGSARPTPRFFRLTLKRHHRLHSKPIPWSSLLVVLVLSDCLVIRWPSSAPPFLKEAHKCGLVHTASTDIDSSPNHVANHLVQGPRWFNINAVVSFSSVKFAFVDQTALIYCSNGTNGTVGLFLCLFHCPCKCSKVIRSFVLFQSFGQQ